MYVKAPYKYACTVCSARWGDPSEEIHPDVCVKCFARQLDAQLDRSIRQKIRARENYEDRGEVWKRRRDEKIAREREEARLERVKHADKLVAWNDL